MPIIKSAKKKLKQDRKKTKVNAKKEEAFKKALQALKKGPVGGKKSISLSFLYKAVDKAAASGVVHKNKAARLKSKISKKFQKTKSQKSK